MPLEFAEEELLSLVKKWDILRFQKPQNGQKQIVDPFYVWRHDC